MIQHYSNNIQNRIQSLLFQAKSSIKIAVAWFTNDLLFQPLLLKLQTGVSVELVLNYDDINCSENNKVDFDKFVINGGILRWNKSERLLHTKYCIIDSCIVITGSYNWTNKAETNDEDITVFIDEASTTEYYLTQFESLSSRFPTEKKPMPLFFEEQNKVDENWLESLSIDEITDRITYDDQEFEDDDYGVVYASKYLRHWAVMGRGRGSDESLQGEYVIKEGTRVICDYAFSKTLIKSIKMPQSLEYIGKSAFEGAESLCSLSIPANVKIIRNQAFKNCSKLKVVIVDASNPNYDSRCNCNAIIDSLTHTMILGTSSTCIPNDIKVIDEYAFCRCYNLSNVVIPKSVSIIKSHAFYQCRQLESIEILNPNIVIDEFAFDECMRIKNISVPRAATNRLKQMLPNFKDFIHFYQEDEYKAIYQDDKKLLKVPNGISKYIIKDGTIVLGENAFNLIDMSVTWHLIEHHSITEVILPKSVTEIDSCVFYYSNLSKIELNEGLQRIGNRAFMGCTNIEDIYLPSSLIQIGNSAFQGCLNLKSINFPQLIADTGNSAFWDSGLKSITIPKNIKTISRNSFRGCRSLKHVTFQEGATKIEDYAFFLCGLESITFSKTLKSIGEGAFKDAGFSKKFSSADNTQIYYPAIEIVFPEALESIGDLAFENFKNIRKIVIPKNLHIIGKHAFSKCENLEEIIFHAECQCTIDAEAFSGCKHLRVVTFPNKVEIIGDKLFTDCSNLVTVAYGGSFLPKNTFEKCGLLSNIVVPLGMKQTIESQLMPNVERTTHEFKDYRDYTKLKSFAESLQWNPYTMLNRITFHPRKK